MAVLWLIFTIFSTVCFLWSASWLSYRNLPPGPRPWPIIGNILLLGKESWVSLAKKYGPIYTFWQGQRPVIVITGAELMHDALITQGDVFSDRCDLYSTQHISCNFKTVNSASGPVWRTLRKNLTAEVLNSTRVRSYKHVRDFEFQNLMKRFKEEARDNNGAVQVLPLVRRTLFNVLNTMCFGERMEESVVREIDHLMAERLGRFKGSLSDYIYFWRLFDWQKVRDVKAVIKRTDELMMPSLVKLREAKRSGETVSGRYVETLLQIQEKEGRDRFTDQHIFSLCSEVLNGGTATSAHLIQWNLARIVATPEVERKMVLEMSTVLGEKALEEFDIESLPYLRAVVAETQRMHGPFTFAVPHAVSKSGVKLGGFNILRDAAILFRIASLGHDMEIWGDPENFRPERFLNEMANVDMTGRKKIAFVPFGAGKRICPAMNLALLNTYMIMGLLVQNFEWSHGDPGAVDFKSTEGPFAGMVKYLKTPIRQREWSTLNMAPKVDFKTLLQNILSVTEMNDLDELDRMMSKWECYYGNFGDPSIS